MIHGEDALTNAVKASQAMFGGDLRGLDEATLADIFSEVPSSTLSPTLLSSGRSLLEVLVEVGVFPSKGEGRRTVKNGGLYLNSTRVEDEGAVLGMDSLLTGTMAVVRVGKKNYHLLRFE